MIILLSEKDLKKREARKLVDELLREGYQIRIDRGMGGRFA